MWLWLLAAFLLTAIWVGGYFLKLQLLWMLVATAVVVLFVIAVLVWRRVRAVRAAKALEREIMRQAEQQAANTRPDRRAEIVELQEQVQKGIASLKASKLGNRRGAAALYALPWYVIIGPPGAGKTTALKHSGLEFPFLDPRGGGVRGIGGTRNCDWWFTNEAILLDTAGRYATEQDDHEEWLAFLGMLRRFRGRKPINGVIVAVSVADLAQATEEQVDGYAVKLRARIDEVMTRLEMVVPVYVMFTKADLIAGFAEFFGDLRKSERGQIWGATFPLDAPEGFDPAKAFDREFELLVEQAHARTIKRLGTERNQEARQKIFQFPLEFQSLRSNLSEFLGALFLKSSFVETPIFRGVYFSSGTQEGRPMDRVLGSMARAFGLRPQVADATEAPKESKSYFVTDLFRKVAFPDSGVAARTVRETRRQRVRQIMYAAAAILIGLMLIIPSTWTYFRNSALVGETKDISDRAVQVKWDDNTPVPQKAAKLDEIRQQLSKVNDLADQRPIAMRWGMFTPDALKQPLRDVYLSILKKQLQGRVQPRLEASLRAVTPESVRNNSDGYSKAFNDLKLYLMMTNPENIDKEPTFPGQWLNGWWASSLNAAKDPASLAALQAHTDQYVDLVSADHSLAWKADDALIKETRATLLSVPHGERDYASLVGDPNRVVQPIRHEDIFRPQDAVSRFVTAIKGVTVDGAYTKQGWNMVRAILGSQQSSLFHDTWVLGAEGDQADFDAMARVADLRKKYFERFAIAWRNFLLDQDVVVPASADVALDEMNALSEPPWAYQRLLTTLNDNVTLDLGGSEDMSSLEKSGLDKVADEAKRKLGTAAPGVDAGGVMASATAGTERPISLVETAFKPLTSFAVPPAPAKEGEPPAATGLGQYQGVLAKLIGVMADLKDSKAAPDPTKLASEFESAYRATTTLLVNQDGFTRPILQPMLMNPLYHAWAAVLHDAGGASSGLWEVSVWKKWDKQLAKKYPFDPNSDVDVKLDDYTNFFKPKDGAVWGFYEANLKSSLEERGGVFEPSKRFKASIGYTGPFLTCLKRTLEITKATFPDKGDASAPVVEFEINLHSVSENVASVTFDVDGKGHEYKNEPEEWTRLQWPAKDAEKHGASLRVRGYGGLDEEIARMGDFGFFRLLDAADIHAAPAKPNEQPSLIAEWWLRSESAVVRMNVRPVKSDNPFSKAIFKGFTCPKHIVAGS